MHRYDFLEGLFLCLHRYMISSRVMILMHGCTFGSDFAALAISVSFLQCWHI